MPQGIQPETVNLGREGYSPDLDVGVMVYYIKSSQNSAFMFDASTAKVLADRCNENLQRETGLAIEKVILSHEHGDHVSGRYAKSIKNVPVVAQDTLVQRFGLKNGGDVALKQGESQAFAMHNGMMNVTNVQAHTQLGTVAMINGVALVGDELESTIHFLVSSDTMKQSNQLQKSNDILLQNNIVKVLPAHGSAAALFSGQFGLDLLQSNQKYLQLMAANPQSVCSPVSNQQQETKIKAKLAQSIGVGAEDITAADFATHIDENCRTVGVDARQAGRNQKQVTIRNQ